MTERRPSPSTVVDVAAVVSRDTLGGKLPGEADCPLLKEAIRCAPSGAFVILDLRGVAFISSSYFSAALRPLWSMSDIDIYPALANVPRDGVEDVLLVLKDQSAAVWYVKLEPNGDRTHGAPELLGSLEPPLATTLHLVGVRDETTAADLVESDRVIGMTAWSNRLAALYQQRLVRKRKDGRRLIYAPSWRE